MLVSAEDKITTLGKKGGYFLKADVSNYFERIPQHNLVNLLRATGCNPGTINLLEEMLLAFRQRDSFGIIQGLFTSDLLGNYYLTDVDADFELQKWESARFVDDIYVHYHTEKDARRGLVHLIDILRKDGLHLNESKSGIYPASILLEEENELDELFKEAADEIREERTKMRFVYGFGIEWPGDTASGKPLVDTDDTEENDIALKAVLRLLKSAKKFRDRIEKIDRFCIPVLQASNSPLGLDRALRGVIKRPHLARMYLSYLATFVSSSEVANLLEKLILEDQLVFEYQIMFALGAVLNFDKLSKELINRALHIVEDRTIGQEVRAIAGILAAKHGAAQQRRRVRLAYETESSPYVRAAILYASRYFTGTERSTCKRAWGGHSITNTLLASSI
jgi:hypothetical protein